LLKLEVAEVVEALYHSSRGESLPILATGRSQSGRSDRQGARNLNDAR
jgi:hypothetical protein